MTWGAVGSTALSIGGSLLGGGSKGAKDAIKAQKDMAARAQFAQDQARRQSMALLDPYSDLGRDSSRKLAELLGVAEPEGYAKRPELQDFEDQLRDEHFQKYHQDYRRDSNVAGQTVQAKYRYDKAMQEWEAGKDAYMQAHPDSQGSGDLLKTFSNEDFVKDPGYDFRMAEGEKGINRALAARGGYDSGSALKALDKYNQEYASNEFSNAYNRDAANKARTFSFLSGASGQGLQAAGQGVGANTNAANTNTQIQSNLGNNLSNIYQTEADNNSNMWQSAIGNGLYAYNRNKPVTGNNSSYGSSGGYSTQTPTYGSGSQTPWYLS